ncbi:hypothetical protein BIW11_09129 [Tropilaelaps mercedesae]|uniref:Uncharacterized protein n=1 Tax=Tropilaelaps mercedesae TaxID=418985 RepID=A0A1V9XLN6_9ACAR|nr:hypothetical protein BIW11_09129 [Tropilaelaps mercedesae]
MKLSSVGVSTIHQSENNVAFLKMSLKHLFPSHSTSEELLNLSSFPSRDASQSEAKATDPLRERVGPLTSMTDLDSVERGGSQEWSQGLEAQEDLQLFNRDVACQTDLECPQCIESVNQMGIAVESRSTQTAPETRSVFTRSSRFLPTRQTCSNSPIPDDPFTLARVSSRGDSTAVLSSRRVRGRFRGRGRGRGRGAAQVNAVNQNALEQNNQPVIGRARQDRRAAGFDTLLALLESRLGEAAGRPIQDPPPAPPPSGRVTTSNPVTQTERQPPQAGGANASADVAIQVVAYDGDSSSSSDTLFAILAPKNHATVFRTTSARQAKFQQNSLALSKDAGVVGQLTPGPSHVAPPRVNMQSTTLNDRTPTTVTGAPSNSVTVTDQLERDMPVTVASAMPIPTLADWITRVNPPPSRNRRGGVRSFFGRLLGKENATMARQRSHAQRNSAVTRLGAPASESAAVSKSLPAVSTVKRAVPVVTGATRSDSDSTH